MKQKLNLLALTIGSLGCSTLAMAATPIVTVSDSIAASSTGILSVNTSDVTSAVTPVEIGGYTVSLLVQPEVGATGSVSLTSASVPADGLVPDTYFGASTSGNLFVVTDADLASTPTVPTLPASLFDIDYSVAPGTSGIFDIMVNQTDPDHSALYDANGNDVAGVTFVGGTVTVPAVPEPTSLAIMCAVGALVLRRRSLRSYR